MNKKFPKWFWLTYHINSILIYEKLIWLHPGLAQLAIFYLDNQQKSDILEIICKLFLLFGINFIRILLGAIFYQEKLFYWVEL